MSEKCDCVSSCGDDSRVRAGSVDSCAEYKRWNIRDSQKSALANVEVLLNEHAKYLEVNAYCYFELAYTRATGWMAFICDRPAGGTVGTAEFGNGRTIITQGQGSTPDEACSNALLALKSKK